MAKHDMGGALLIHNPAIEAARAQRRQMQAAAQPAARRLLQANASAPVAQDFFRYDPVDRAKNCIREALQNRPVQARNLVDCLGVGLPRRYGLQALGPAIPPAVNTVGRMNNAPFGATVGNRTRIFWLQSDGEIFHYAFAEPGDTPMTGPQAIGKIQASGTDLFEKQILIATTSGVFYATGASGTLYSIAFDAASLNTPPGGLIPDPVVLNRDSASVGPTQPGVAVPGPFFDFLAGRVVTVSNLGHVTRWVPTPGQATFAPGTGANDSFDIPRIMGGGAEEYFVANSVCFGGAASIGSWVKDDVDPLSDFGRYHSYSFNDGSLATSILDYANKLPGPLDFDYSTSPALKVDYTIIPTGNFLTYVYRSGSSYVANRSRALVVDNASPPSGHPGALNPSLLRPDGDGIACVPQMGRGDTVTVQNAGALFTLSYGGATPADRVIAFKSLAKTWYTKTATGAAGFCTSGSPARYTQNVSTPLYDFINAESGAPSDAYLVADNGPGPDASNRTFLNRFTYNLNLLSAPTLTASYDLRLTDSAAAIRGTQLPGPSLGMLGSGTVFFATMNNTSTAPNNAVMWLSPRQ